MNLLIIKHKFSIQQLGTQRLKFKHKICFKNSLKQLALKSTPTIAITTRLLKDGKFLKLYKLCQKIFIKVMLYQIDKLPYNNEFKNLFFQYQSFKDFNRVLFWKIMSINCLFNLKKIKKKKFIYYLKPERRCVLILLWLKNIIKLKKLNYNNLNLRLFKPLTNFLFINKNNNDMFFFKLKIYKSRLVRG